MQVIKNDSQEGTKNVEINYSLFPSIGFTQSQIKQNEILIEKLNIKKKILSEKVFEDELSQVDNDITLIKIDFELAKCHTSIITKQNSLNDYIQNVIKPNYQNMLDNFSNVVMEAHELSKEDSTLKEALNQINWTLINDNYDHRINHFIALKKYLDSKK